MNEEMQPVSMHDTPHKHHGALPLIAAMLGVFLVLESIVLGYVVTKYVGVEQAEDEVNEQTADRREEVIDEVKDKVKDQLSKNNDDMFWSHLVLDGEPHEFSEGDEYTWLNGTIMSQAEETNTDGCVAVYGLVDEGMRQGMGVSTDALTDPDVLALFSDRVSDAGITNLGITLESFDDSLFKVCTGETEDYVIMLDSSGGVATLASYGDENSYWQRYQPVGGVMDGVVSLWFEIFPDTPVLSTGYGDAGWTWWSYWAPTEHYSMQLIERCTNGPKDLGDGGLDYETRVITCNVEYVK